MVPIQSQYPLIKHLQWVIWSLTHTHVWRDTELMMNSVLYVNLMGNSPLQHQTALVSWFKLLYTI